MCAYGMRLYAVAEFEKYQKQLKTNDTDELDRVLNKLTPAKK